MSKTVAGDFKPRVLVFCCNWCAYAGADLAGVSRLKITPHFRVIRTMCSGRVDPELILEAFAEGADGIMVAGCHPGDCHYMEGNYKARRRVALLKDIMNTLGLDTERVWIRWIGADEGRKFARTVAEMAEKLREMGPNPMQKHWAV